MRDDGVRCGGRVVTWRTRPTPGRPGTIWMCSATWSCRGGGAAPHGAGGGCPDLASIGPLLHGLRCGAGHLGRSPGPPTTNLVLEQALLDVLLEVPVASATSRFSIDPTGPIWGSRPGRCSASSGGRDGAGAAVRGEPGAGAAGTPPLAPGGLQLRPAGLPPHPGGAGPSSSSSSAVVIPSRRFVPAGPPSSPPSPLAHSITLGAAALRLGPYGPSGSRPSSRR